MEPIGVADALDLLGHGLDRTAVGPLTGRPVLVVSVDRARHDGLADLSSLLPTLPCVAVALDDTSDLSAPAPGFDVVATSRPDPPRPWVGADTVEALTHAVLHHPIASVVLAQLLRRSHDLSIVDALAAESTSFGLLQAGPEFAAWLAARPSAPVAPDEPGPPVHVTRSRGRLEVTLDRPHVHNAVNAALRDALVEALAVADADPTVTHVVVRGAGPSFSSGGDLAEFGTAADPATAHLIRSTHSPAAALARLADEVTVVTHGDCIGAGVELAAFAGRVVARPGTTFRLPEVSMGLIPGAGGTVSVTRRVGRERAGWLAITGATLDAETAAAWGLVDEVTDAAV